MPTAHLFQAAPLAFAVAARIDAEQGVIHDVAVITQGPALGHGMMVDRVTLEQMKAAAETYSGGLKVKVSRGEGHRGDFAEIVGALKNFRIVGDKLLADLHLLRTAQDRAFVLEVAQTMPDSFGMSVAFSGPTEEKAGIRYARCAEIYSSDLVGEPAANPDGLFGRRFDEWRKNKGNQPETPNHSMENELLSEIGKLIDTKLGELKTDFDKQLGELKTAQGHSLSKIEEVSKLSAAAADEAAKGAIKEFAKTLGAPAGAAAAPSAPATAPVVKTFEVLVKEHPKYATSKLTAQKEVIATNGDAYREYLARCQKGEIVLF